MALVQDAEGRKKYFTWNVKRSLKQSYTIFLKNKQKIMNQANIVFLMLELFSHF